MAVAAPDQKDEKAVDSQTAGDPLPYDPPEEGFWHRYSWHGEFPISLFATIAIHVAIGAVLIYILHLQFKEKKSDERTPVPTRGMKIADGERGGDMGNPGGGGGGEPQKEITEQRPSEPQRQVPTEVLKKELVSASNWVPDLKDNPEALEKIIQSPGYERLNKLNDDLKRRIAQGFAGGGGKGNGMGMGPAGDPGNGAGGKGGKGDSSTSGNRSVRWTILFRTNSGQDYVEQLAAFKAKIVIPEPPSWKTNLLFEDILNPKPKQLGDQELPKMYFVDEDRISASKVARALGLEYDPPQFIAFFPKDIEESLAAKERAYRNRREDQIYSTTFRVLPQNGKYEVTVTEQIPSNR